MRRTKIKWIGAALVLVMLGVSAQAHAFRCGNRIISRGDHSSKLLHYCGEPASVQTRLAQRTFGTGYNRVYIPGFVEDVWIEEWTYNLGPSKLMRFVRIENGFVTEIKNLGYGYSSY